MLSGPGARARATEAAKNKDSVSKGIISGCWRLLAARFSCVFKAGENMMPATLAFGVETVYCDLSSEEVRIVREFARRSDLAANKYGHLQWDALSANIHAASRECLRRSPFHAPFRAGVHS